MEKLVLKRRPPAGRGSVVRIDATLLAEVETLSCKTGYSLKKLMDILVRYALDNTVVEGGEPEEENKS